MINPRWFIGCTILPPQDQNFPYKNIWDYGGMKNFGGIQGFPALQPSMAKLTRGGNQLKPTSKPKSGHAHKILGVGKEKGYITYKQVNDILPDEVVSSEEIDDILLMLGENDIKIVEQDEKSAILPDEEKEAGSLVPGGAMVKDEEEDEGDDFEKPSETAAVETRMGDPVKMYLHEMGKISWRPAGGSTAYTMASFSSGTTFSTRTGFRRTNGRLPAFANGWPTSTRRTTSTPLPFPFTSLRHSTSGFSAR